MIAAATSGRLCLGVVTESARFTNANGAVFVLLFHRQQSSLRAPAATALQLSHRSPCRPPLAFTRHRRMGSVADMFQARLEALQRQSEINDRKVAATIANCHQLIAEHQAAEAKWAAENPDLL